MTSFDFAAAIQARPSDADLPIALGRFSYRESPTQRGAVIPDPAWAGTHLVQVNLTQFPDFPTSSGRRVQHLTMHRQVAPVFIATMQLAQQRGLLKTLHEYNGCYVARHMGWTPGRPLSVHSWAAAVDFDAATNGYGVPFGRMQINKDFVRLMEECGWTWGGRWTSSYADGMHFQWSDPLPGTVVPTWQDAMAKTATPLKPVSPTPIKRRVFVNGQPVGVGRTVTDGVAVLLSKDGSAWLQPADGHEAAVAATGAVDGNSTRVTLLDQADVWVPFSGRAIYRGLMVNLNPTTYDLHVRPATAEERASSGSWSNLPHVLIGLQ
ncbi:M15 family metallopeptidase [Deinococcus hopiensis]|uniref:D-alanyl-D-alanine carboxypeptidase n=1 Tax=Deinococcus hopiensis KR-140 TaxID=695939 RepID=A0A1W1UZJ8_9DEIO|nr:M15 family metallopeptidase [Deinococcus hopiensis]SMB86496.1 D-alanyl-D-alanine carboxypeptidase [Deinococcus hopiensis KR-140]